MLSSWTCYSLRPLLGHEIHSFDLVHHLLPQIWHILLRKVEIPSFPRQTFNELTGEDSAVVSVLLPRDLGIGICGPSFCFGVQGFFPLLQMFGFNVLAEFLEERGI